MLTRTLYSGKQRRLVTWQLFFTWSLTADASVPPDYQLAESNKLDLDYSDEKSDFRDTNFPARYIYEHLLPSVVERLSDIHYHRSSPYSGFGKKTTDQQYGDLHQCQWIVS